MTFRLKRRAAPRAWTVPRKGTKWLKRPAPGRTPRTSRSRSFSSFGTFDTSSRARGRLGCCFGPGR